MASSVTTASSQAVPEEVKLLTTQAEKLYSDGKYPEAMSLAQRALALSEAALGPDHPEIAGILESLAVLYWVQGSDAKAEPLLVRALDIRKKALGVNHPDVVASLIGLAALYQQQHAYSKAEPLLARALAIREETLGPTHQDVAESLHHLAQLYKARGEYRSAEPLYVRALSVAEQALGPAHREVAAIVHNLGELYQAQGIYDKVEPLYIRALQIHEQVLGPAHRDTAASLNNLATLYAERGAYAQAESLLVRARDILEQAHGPSHPEFAQSVYNLAALYRKKGAYADAESLYVRALDIREKALGPFDPAIAESLNGVAGLYRTQGAYAKAEPLYLRALEIREQVLGPNHPAVAISLNNLAGLYKDQGTYTKAEPLYVRALEIRERALGPNHPDVATSLNSLAGLYKNQGAHAKAEPLHTRALTICENTLGATHPDVARGLNELALLYRTQGAYAKAETLLLRAMEILEANFGQAHPGIASCLNNLAPIYYAQGGYAKAEPILIRARDIFEQTFGCNHRDFASTLNNLAQLHHAQGAYAQAEPLYARSLTIFEQTLGPRHPFVAGALNNLAVLAHARGAHDEAEPLFRRAAEIRELQLRNELGRLSEMRKRDLAATLLTETIGLVSFHAEAAPDSAAALDLAFETVLRRKGRLLDSLVDNQTTLRAHLTPQLQTLLDQLSQTRSELVARLYGQVDPHNAPMRQLDTIASLRAHIDQLESALAAASDELRTQIAPISVTAVQTALPADTALVEFVHYRRLDPRRIQQHWQEHRYGAYLLTQQGPPRWVALGEVAAIGASVDRVVAAMDRLFSVDDAKTALQRLDTLLFAPVRGQLPAGISHLILAPDDKLNLVPFEALIDADGRYALERYLVSYVTSGRDLLRLDSSQQPRSAPVIMAGPTYGTPPAMGASGALSFLPLAGAEAEAADLGAYFHTTPVTGANATKAALAALPGPAILHIATHGFYRPPTATTVAASRNANPVAWRDQARDINADLVWLPPPAISDPAEGLDHSGLAMAGANQGPDGIVTAREIAGFDWWGTQLVVLSACQTGVGAIASGDGLYGLRRALVLAGSASQVVSLWSVSDSATRALMRDYYSELKRGTGRAEALRQAKLRMLSQRDTAHPFYWAAFIAAGDWRPLDATVFRFAGAGHINAKVTGDCEHR